MHLPGGGPVANPSGSGAGGTHSKTVQQVLRWPPLVLVPVRVCSGAWRAKPAQTLWSSLRLPRAPSLSLHQPHGESPALRLRALRASAGACWPPGVLQPLFQAVANITDMVSVLTELLV